MTKNIDFNKIAFKKVTKQTTTIDSNKKEMEEIWSLVLPKYIVVHVPERKQMIKNWWSLV